jgi:hypothetical protein
MPIHFDHSGAGVVTITCPATGNFSFDPSVGGGGGGLTVTLQATGFTAADKTVYLCDTSAGAFAATLPAATSGMLIEFVDSDGTWGTNALTITPNGADKINNTSGNLVCNVANARIRMVYHDTTRGWQIDIGGNFVGTGTWPLINGIGVVGGTVTLTPTAIGALASTGTPAIPSGATATTQAAGDNTTSVATDAFVKRETQPIGTVALTPGTTVTLTPSVNTSVFTLTPAQTTTLNGGTMIAGQRFSVVVTTSGTTSYTITFGTNFKTTATLATGTVTAKIFVIDFICTSTTQAVETGRTAAI